MREYEIVVVYDMAVAEAGGADAAADHLSGLIEARGGNLLKMDHWGRRRMAYPINRALDGDYVLVRAELEPTEVTPLEAALRINERIFRHLVVRADELPVPPPPREPRIPPGERGEVQAAPAAAPVAEAPAVEAPVAEAPAAAVAEEPAAVIEEPAVAEAPAAPVEEPAVAAAPVAEAAPAAAVSEEAAKAAPEAVEEVAEAHPEVDTPTAEEAVVSAIFGDPVVNEDGETGDDVSPKTEA